MSQAAWWTSSILPSMIMLFNIGVMAIIFGGFIFLLIKIASIDRTLKEIAQKLDER